MFCLIRAIGDFRVGAVNEYEAWWNDDWKGKTEVTKGRRPAPQ